MKRLLPLIVIIMLITPAFGVPSSLTLENVSGTWSNAVDGTNVNYISNLSSPYGNGVLNQVRWGTTNSGDGQSGLGFVGIAPPPMGVLPDVPFVIGQLIHYNRVIGLNSASTSVDLSIQTTIDSKISNFKFTFLIDETNNAPGPPASDDIITFPDSFSSGKIDNEYTLNLLGFGDSPTSLDSSFRSPEGNDNNTLLWGELTHTPIPAPGAILMAGFGAIITNRLRRQQLI